MFKRSWSMTEHDIVMTDHQYQPRCIFVRFDREYVVILDTEYKGMIGFALFGVLECMGMSTSLFIQSKRRMMATDLQSWSWVFRCKAVVNDPHRCSINLTSRFQDGFLE
jgi:hypothetical protein